jgi:AbrB family looped-hinge helix DNA binding protein
MSTEIQTKAIRVGKRGTLVIPVEMRRSLGIEEGDTLQATVCDGKLTVTPIPADPWERLRKAGSKFFEGVDAKAYIRALRDEWDD